MSYLIDTTYFASGQTAINNSSDTGWAGSSVAANISDYIARYEPEYLIKLLGYTLYTYLVAHPTEARIVALITKLRNSTDKISPIANYVYYKYRQQDFAVQTEAGDKETTPSGFSPMANFAKHCAVWNWMVDQNNDIITWIQDNISTYPEYDQISDFDKENFELFTYVNHLGI